LILLVSGFDESSPGGSVKSDCIENTEVSSPIADSTSASPSVLSGRVVRNEVSGLEDLLQ
jgi:hypothetical protein